MLPVEILIQEGLFLMVIGMGTVFVFLMLLVFLMSLMSKLIPAEEVSLTQPPTDAKAIQDKKRSAIIAAAITAYKNQ